MQAKTVTLLFMQCYLARYIRSQPFYYEDDKAYYPDIPGADMYSLDPLEHHHDDSMKALTDITDMDSSARSDVHIKEYDNTDTNSDSRAPPQASGTPATEAISLVHGSSAEPQGSAEYKDLPNDNLESATEMIVQSGLEEIKKGKKITFDDVTSSEDDIYTRHNEQKTESPFGSQKHAKELTHKEASDLSRPPGADVTSNEKWSTLKNNGIKYETWSTTDGYNNGSMAAISGVSNRSCDPQTHSGCDVLHYERCNPDTRQCRCLNGFLPENPTPAIGSCKGAPSVNNHTQCRFSTNSVAERQTVSCRTTAALRPWKADAFKNTIHYSPAVSFYHGQLKLRDYMPSKTISEEDVLSIRQRLLTLIRLSLKKRGVDFLLDLNIHKIEIEDQQPTLTFELGLHKDALSGDEDIKRAISRDVMLMSEGEFLVDTVPSHVTSGSNASSAAIVEVNPCLSQEHNHCSPRASCSYTSRTVSCHCHPGFEDVTPNLYRLPGEVCMEKCTCHNGGVCVDIDLLSGSRQCSCLNWYFGSECQVNGKELLLICCCSLGSVAIIGVIMCCCYYGCNKHKDNSPRSSMFSLSPDISILKLPRVWMDTTSYEQDLSAPDPRKMSLASERSPYFDGYIMEDVPLGTLHRHSDNHSSYYQLSQASLGHCPATVSTHSFYRY